MGGFNITDDETREKNSRKKFFILSVDGGGIRGLIPLRALQCLQKILAEQGKEADLAKQFDLMAGTSTGAIIVAGLCCPDLGGGDAKSACTVEDLLRLYEEKGQKIFNSRGNSSEAKNWIGLLLGQIIGWPFRNKHDARMLEEYLETRLSNRRISETRTDVIMTAFDVKQLEPILMTNDQNLTNFAGKFHDYSFLEAARASSAAPTYLLPKRVVIEATREEQILVDGGLFANNPTIIAYLSALRRGYRDKNIFILSLGAGYRFQRMRYADAGAWRSLGDWLSPGRDIPLLSILLEAPSKSTATIMAKCVPNCYRIDGDLGQEVKFDDARNATLESLKSAATAIVNTSNNRDQLVEFARLLR